ncbi:HAD family hydrolase [Microbacterium nymphoidis]|uniref:HAD family hydrolase n=1 Tax=Microbacterium nymphoidis TaxID=2898586 RepID=UPI001E307BF7|nr:HAD family hydrolase [Microbacterium nymphoidis]MCD2498630.1 HAD family hydrolase [Microbacterium nymphoidis]
MTSTPIELIVLDMAGTTVRDDGVVERAFQRAAEATGVAAAHGWDAALQYVRDTMGQSKIDVFTHLAGGDRTRAEEATAAFEAAYAELIATDGAEAIPGAEDLFRAQRAAGRMVILTTGFAPVTRDAIIDALGWRELIDGALSPVDAGRGRPYPDLVLAAALRARVSSMSAVAVIGDTASDVGSGTSARAGLVIGVTSGAHDEEVLAAAGADVVLGSVAEIRDVPALAV